MTRSKTCSLLLVALLAAAALGEGELPLTVRADREVTFYWRESRSQNDWARFGQGNEATLERFGHRGPVDVQVSAPDGLFHQWVGQRSPIGLATSTVAITTQRELAWRNLLGLGLVFVALLCLLILRELQMRRRTASPPD